MTSMPPSAFPSDSCHGWTFVRRTSTRVRLAARRRRCLDCRPFREHRDPLESPSAAPGSVDERQLRPFSRRLSRRAHVAGRSLRTLRGHGVATPGDRRVFIGSCQRVALSVGPLSMGHSDQLHTAGGAVAVSRRKTRRIWVDDAAAVGTPRHGSDRAARATGHPTRRPLVRREHDLPHERLGSQANLRVASRSPSAAPSNSTRSARIERSSQRLGGVG